MPGTNNEPTVSEDALEASLGELLKAADAEDVVDQLNKGGQVYSGFQDERGKKGGGGASSSDAGGLDNMMIGKLVAGGMEGEAAKAVVGSLFGMLTEAGMLGKQNGEEEEEEEEDEGMTGYARGYADALAKMGKSEDDPSDPLNKSHGEEFREDPEIGEAVDASPFMEAITSRMTGALDGLRKSVGDHRSSQDNVNRKIAGALYQQGMLIKSQRSVIVELGNRLGIVESQPAGAPKGAPDLTGAQAMAKSVDGHGAVEPLNKSQAGRVLSYMRFEKNIEDINGEQTGTLACMVEGGGVLSKSVQEYMHRWLTAHPNERERAINYA